MSNHHDHGKDQPRDDNRDPISGAPGSHPGGVATGGVAGAAAVGAATGAVLGPIGILLGGTAGAIAGAAIGKGIAESIDPTSEAAYWREHYRGRPYVRDEYDYERDYAAAYGFGLQAREAEPARGWEESENDLKQRWNEVRGQSRLDWDTARGPVHDAWHRADRTHRAYAASDAHFAERFKRATYRKPDASFEDYRPAYRFGTHARTRYRDREWDDALEAELRREWEIRNDSPLEWEHARHAARDAFNTHAEYLPDFANRADRPRFEVS